MAANGITLKPVRMGDLVNSGAKSAATVAVGKYVPPSRRQNSEESMAPATAEIKMSEENFPTLGTTPKRAPVWGKNAVKSSSTEPNVIEPKVAEPKVAEPKVAEPKVAEPKVAEPKVAEPKVAGPSLSDKIKEKIRLDAIAEEERVRGGETDLWKMSPAQLEAEGWISLPLKSSKNVSY